MNDEKQRGVMPQWTQADIDALIENDVLFYLMNYDTPLPVIYYAVIDSLNCLPCVGRGRDYLREEDYDW